MKTTYFTTFQLGSKSKPLNNYSELYKVIKKWLEKPVRGFKLPKDVNFIKENIDDYQYKGHRLSTRYSASTEHGKYLALKYDHPDSTEEGIIWTTEIIIGDRIRETDVSSRIAIKISYGGSSPYLRPVHRNQSRPSIINDLIKKLGAFESLPLLDKHVRLPLRDIETFIQVLNDENRYLPILFISREAEKNKTSVDLKKLISQCSGLAYIIVADDSRVTWELDSFLGKSFNCFDGALRIYWPRFKLSDNPYSHPLWTSSKIEEISKRPTGFETYIFKILSEHSSSRFVHEALTWDGANRLFRKLEIEELKRTGNQDEWIKLLEDDNADLEAKVRGLENENDTIRQDTFQLRSQITHLKTQLNSKQGEEPLEDDFSNCECIEDVIAQVKISYADYIVIPKNITINEKFEDIDNFLASLKWLALTYRKAKLGELRIPDIDHSCKENCGFSYEPNQSEITMGIYKNEYEMNYKGESYKLKEHIGQGSSKDPRYTIRIAFFFDDEDKKVVVGYMGQHQKTRST